MTSLPLFVLPVVLSIQRLIASTVPLSQTRDRLLPSMMSMTSTAIPVTEQRETRSVLHTYAEPLSGLRVSWGAVLAGAVAIMAVALLLWELTLAVTMTATRGAPMSAIATRNTFVALWVGGIGTTLIGALAGGLLAGYLPGNPSRSIGAVHGFLAWALAFLVSFGVQIFVIGGIVRAASEAAISSAAVEVPSPSMDPEGSPEGMPDRLPEGPGQAQRDAQKAMTLAHDWVAGFSWSWFGTWFAAGVLATLTGASAGRHSRKRELVAQAP
jgi:hypothetical protein